MNARLERHLRRGTLGLALGLLALFAGRALRRHYLPLPEDRCRTRRFAAAAWRDSTQVYSAAAVRGCMVDDLLKRHQLVGQSRAAVVALLGEPAPTPYFREYDLVYWLGPERGMLSIDSEWLVLRLDSGGRVSERRLVTD
jgi:hypothetical protein